MIARINLIAWIGLLFVGLICNPATPELQRGELGDFNDDDITVLSSERTPVRVSDYEKLDLRLKWAIVRGGGINSASDRIRVRLHCNNEKWIDLVATRVGGQIGEFNSMNLTTNRIYLATSKKQIEDEFYGKRGEWASVEIPHFNIVHWSHEELWIKHVLPSKPINDDTAIEPTPDQFFKFDLTK